MNVTYNADKNSCLIEINGQSEEIPLEKLLDLLPEKLVRDKHLVNMLMNKREEAVKQIGDFNDYIVVLTKKINDVNTKIENLDPETDIKSLKFYNSMVANLKSEKDVVRELRHGIKLSHAEEGRLAKELAELENVRG